MSKTDTPIEEVEQKPVLTSAPASWHSHVAVAAMLGYFLSTFPTMESLDEAATVETFTKVLFPEYMSLETVTGIRLLFAFIVFFDCIYAILWGKWDQSTDYQAGSQLVTVIIPFRGIFLQPDRSIWKGLLTMSSFTMISWLLLGIGFCLSATISLLHILNMDVSPWLLRTALLIFECAAPTTLLVSAVVKYILWPMALQQGSRNSCVLNNPVSILEHNGNVVMALAEVALLGGLPVRLSDIAVAPIFGSCYVYFTWWMADKWADKDRGPQFMYPFFDTTLGWGATIALVALLTVLAIFYCVFAYADYCISLLSGGILSHVAAIGVMVMLVCRLRD